MKPRVLAIAACVAISTLSGCALTTDRIELQYKPQQNVTKIPGANEISVNVQVVDLRQDKSKVSCKKNGFGAEMAPIVAVDDVTVTIRKAIEQELRARGFQLASDSALIQISADLTRFYNDFKTGFFAGDSVADLNMLVTVKSKKGDVLFTRQVMEQGIEPNIQLMSGENARLALDKALEKGMQSLFDDHAFLAALTASASSKAASQ